MRVTGFIDSTLSSSPYCYDYAEVPLSPLLLSHTACLPHALRKRQNRSLFRVFFYICLFSLYTICGIIYRLKNSGKGLGATLRLLPALGRTVDEVLMCRYLVVKERRLSLLGLTLRPTFIRIYAWSAAVYMSFVSRVLLSSNAHNLYSRLRPLFSNLIL